MTDARDGRKKDRATAQGTVRIGISGWRYKEWRGDFYPEGLVQTRELAYAAERMRTIEINGSFYSLQRPSSYQTWASQTPPGFVFGVKGGRFLTHIKRLRDCAAPLANFFASGVLALEEKLGPILWQLPPQLAYDAAQLEAFLALLPRTTKAAAVLARAHDHRLKFEPHVDVSRNRRLRYALEVRHPTFGVASFYELLAKYDVASCIADSAGKFPTFDALTAGFVYVRLHGDTELYASAYSPKALDRWARRIEVWTGEGRDVYVYFDNDARGHAPYDAMNLAARLGYGARVVRPPRGKGLYEPAIRGAFRKEPEARPRRRDRVASRG